MSRMLSGRDIGSVCCIPSSKMMDIARTACVSVEMQLLCYTSTKHIKVLSHVCPNLKLGAMVCMPKAKVCFMLPACEGKCARKTKTNSVLKGGRRAVQEAGLGQEQVSQRCQ